MKQFFILLGFLLLLAVISGTSVRAVTTEEIYEECGAAGLEVEGAAAGNGGIASKLGGVLSSAFEGSIGGVLKYSAAIAGCVLLISLLNGFRALREDSALDVSFDFVSAAVLAAAAFPAVYTVFSYTKAAVDALCIFTASFLPVMAALYTMGGNPAQGLAASSGMTLFLTAAQTVGAQVVMPFLSLGFALALAGALPGASSLAPVTAFLKNSVCMIIAFVFSLISFVFYFQTAIAASADSFAYRSVKFASGTFIPVIGNAVGESSRTVFGAVNTVKGSVGALGLSVMLVYLLPPIVSALLYKTALSLCALFARLCGCEKESKFIGDMSALLGAALALLISCTVVFVVMSAVFLKSGAN